MPASLYVCAFSNGHIKVGRSIDATARIASHADRVSCMGVTLAESYITECPDNDEAREQALIARCLEAAEARFQLEWFTGLQFREVCAWAYEAAHSEFQPSTERATRWTKLIADLRGAGWTHAALARECNCGAATMSRLALGQQDEPMYSTGETLLRLAAAAA